MQLKAFGLAAICAILMTVPTVAHHSYGNYDLSEWVDMEGTVSELVYVACAAAASTGGILNAIAYMLVFGSGTLPMMLAASLFGKRLQISLRLRFQRLIPAALTLVGLILVLRGLALGIPYLSPDLASPDSHCAQCFADTPAGSVNP